VLLHGPFPAGGVERAVSDGIVLGADPVLRAEAFARIAATGASVVRIPLNWRSVAIADPPPGFDARDPASAAYDFAAIDASVRDAAAAGLAPLLVISRAPAFAEAPQRWPYAYPGSWDPSPEDLEAFAAAVATRYDGRYPDPTRAGAALPAVHLFQAWNEPNLARYLEPQWVASEGSWRPFAPLAYRNLLNAFYAGIKSAQAAATVIAAGIAPNGEPPGVGRMAPLTFLRTLLCVSPAGTRAPSGCPEPPHFDVLAFHPLSVASPDAVARGATDVAIADAAKVSALLGRARALGTALPAGSKQLWVTELNWESSPQSPRGVPPASQALWISRALHRLWAAGVSLVSWEFLVDPSAPLQAATPGGGSVTYHRPAGLYAAGPGPELTGARPKQFERGFALPFDPLRASAREVRVWALASPGLGLVAERLRHGRWRALATLHADRAGVLNALLPLRGSAVLRLRGAAGTSATERVGRRPFPG
jgi:hypothetical protein